jgi:hypothetical protein
MLMLCVKPAATMQRRGLADDAGDGQDHAGDDARHGGRQDDPQDRPPLRDAEGVGRLAQLVGHDRSSSSVERTTTGIISTDSARAPEKPLLVPGPKQQRHQGVGEQAGHDRGDAGHHVHEERDPSGQVPRPYSDEVDRRQQADRHRDQVAMPVMIKVPQMAWTAPPPTPTTLRIELVKNGRSKRFRPFARVDRRHRHQRHEGQQEGTDDEAGASGGPWPCGPSTRREDRYVAMMDRRRSAEHGGQADVEGAQQQGDQDRARAIARPGWRAS